MIKTSITTTARRRPSLNWVKKSRLSATWKECLAKLKHKNTYNDKKNTLESHRMKLWVSLFNLETSMTFNVLYEWWRALVEQLGVTHAWSP